MLKRLLGIGQSHSDDTNKRSISTGTSFQACITFQLLLPESCLLNTPFCLFRLCFASNSILLFITIYFGLPVHLAKFEQNS